MPLTNNTNDNYTICQLKLPLEIEKLIDIADPAYNVQAAICDEYIAVIDAKPYASVQDCFVPLMEKFKETYGHFPKYPVADAGYGSYNNYLYCEEHGMEKYMKFTMFEKETKNERYHTNPYRAVNFRRDAEGTFGIINWDRNYKRLLRRGKERVLLELTLISCGYNLYKYHNKKASCQHCYLTGAMHSKK